MSFIFLYFFNVGRGLHFRLIAPRSFMVGRGSGGRIRGKMEYFCVMGRFASAREGYERRLWDYFPVSRLCFFLTFK